MPSALVYLNPQRFAQQKDRFADRQPADRSKMITPSTFRVFTFKLIQPPKIELSLQAFQAFWYARKCGGQRLPLSLWSFKEIWGVIRGQTYKSPN
ncbi:MAG: hypothetical protein DMG11_18555 [Acidobacteria bacterium]|nr:MAG: hypothetical protein DMG11_18555 [Acidobacteriota bacterium]